MHEIHFTSPDEVRRQRTACQIHARQKMRVTPFSSNPTLFREIVSLEAFKSSRSALGTNIIRRASRARRVAAWSVVLVVWSLGVHTGNIGSTLNWLAHIPVCVCEHVVVIDRSIIADAFDEIDRFLAAPTDGPMSTAARRHKDCFSQGSAVGVGHGHCLAPVASGFGVGASGRNVLASRCHFTGGGSGPFADSNAAARAAHSSVSDIVP